MYDVIANLLGTQPIRVRFSRDAVHFSCGEAHVQLPPVIWFEGPAASGRVEGIGDRPSGSNGERIDLMSDSFRLLSTDQRRRVLTLFLNYGFRQVPQRWAIQRPRVIFSNAALLATAFDSHEREALEACALRSSAHEVLFE